jgi:hypothetical protein
MKHISMSFRRLWRPDGETGGWFFLLRLREIGAAEYIGTPAYSLCDTNASR